MQAEREAPDATVQLVYDRECPICELYCTNTQLGEDAPELELIDAREDSGVMAEITDAGLDIDEGMVVKVDGQLLYGPDAIHKLAELSNRRGLFNRLGRLGFGGAARARLLYPLAKACRNLLLKLLRKSRINNLEQPGRDRF